VLDLVSQGRDIVLMSVYLDLGKPVGAVFWMRGYMSKGREMESLVYEQPGYEVDGSYHIKEGSKYVEGDEWGAKGNKRRGKQKQGDHSVIYCIQSMYTMNACYV
jgi:hypothetical protein